MSPALRQPATAAAGEAAAPAAAARAAPAERVHERWAPWLRLAAFSALALFGAAHWGSLVASPPRGRMLLVVLVAAAGGALLILLGRRRCAPGSPLCWATARVPRAR